MELYGCTPPFPLCLQGAYQQLKYRNSIQGVRGIIAAGGVRALYKGWVLACAKTAPATAVQFLLYEALLKFADANHVNTNVLSTVSK